MVLFFSPHGKNLLKEITLLRTGPQVRSCQGLEDFLLLLMLGFTFGITDMYVHSREQRDAYLNLYESICNKI
jgi:hypothetical protein